MTAAHRFMLAVPHSALAVAVPLLFALGCTTVSSTIKEVGCTVDTDCDGDMRCFDRRICIKTSVHSHSVVMRVSPGPSSGLVEEHFDVEIGGPMPVAITWQLTAPARVRGTVRLATKGAGLSDLIPGTLIATSPGKIGATQLRYTASSLLHLQQDEPGKDQGEGGKAAESRKWGFELRVQAGQTYEVAFWPQSDELPPHYEQRTFGGDVDDLAIVLAASPDIITVSGRIISRPATVTRPLHCESLSAPAAVTSCVGQCKPLPLLRIALIDELGRQRSTIATTGVDGRFSLKTDATTEQLRLRFGPAADEPSASKAVSDARKLALSLPSGTLTATIDAAALHKAGLLKKDLGDINFGPIPPHHKLVRDIQGDNGLPLAGAKVRVIRPLASPKRCQKVAGAWVEVDAIANFEVQRTDISDSTGRIELRTISGKGSIVVVPPANSSSAVWVSKDVELSPTTEPIRCSSRRKIKGLVHFLNLNNPIHSATIHIQPLPAVDGGVAPADPSMAPIFVSSNDQGRYGAWLDPGRYAMIVEPPAGSGLARTVSKILEVSAPSKADAAPLECDLGTWPPTVLHGRLLGIGRKPQAGVLVDVLGKRLRLLKTLANKPPSVAFSSEEALVVLQTHSLGSAVTDSDGHFEILVAPGNLAE